MKDPIGELKKRALEHLEKKEVPEQIKELVQSRFTEFVQQEPIVLTRTEKKRIYQDVVQMLFDDILNDL